MKQLLLALLLVSFASTAALADSPEAILKDMQIIKVESMDEVLSNALVCEEQARLFCGRNENAAPLSESLLKEEYRLEHRH